jgi:hypothetical protein
MGTPTRAQCCWSLLPLLALVAGASGCTLDAGRGFAHVSGRLWSRFAGLDAAGRLKEGWYATSGSFEVQLARLELELRDLSLHGGRADAAEAALASLEVRGPQSLLGQGTRLELPVCQPSCELPAAELTAVRAEPVRLRLQGHVRDVSVGDRLGGQSPAVSLDLGLTGATLVCKLAAAELVDHDHPYYLDLSVELPVSDTLLDGVEWQTLDRSDAGVIVVDDNTNRGAGTTLATNLAQSTLRVTVRRAED